jgi:hypothetical protein
MRKLLVFFAVILIALPLLAQPVFTEEDLPDIGFESTHTMDEDTIISVKVGSTGGPQTWDFSRDVTGSSQTFEVIEVAGTPAADSFPEADFVQYLNTWVFDSVAAEVWNYVQTTSTQVLHLGDYIEAGMLTDTVRLYKDYEPDRYVTPLPLEMGAQWKDSFYRADTIDTAGLINIQIWSVGHSEVDAWGTVIVPAGSFNALRVITYDTTISLFTFFIPQEPDTSRTIGYTWVAADVGTVAHIVSSEDETDPEFEDAETYVVMVDYKGNAVGESPGASPTPHMRVAGNKVYFSLPQPGEVELDIYNAAGCRATLLYRGALSAGEHSLPLPADLTSGVYFLRIKTPLANLSTKFIVLD